ncbi:MAG: FAD binding domain-containing protein [Candidatus Neomarinimicrobiota bacterium]
MQPKVLTSAAVLKSGGTDLLDLMKEGLSRPDKIVNIRNIPGLDKILFDSKKGLTIGPNVTLADMEADRVIKEKLFRVVSGCWLMRQHLNYATWLLWVEIWHSVPDAGIFVILITSVFVKGQVPVLRVTEKMNFTPL